MHSQIGNHRLNAKTCLNEFLGSLQTLKNFSSIQLSAAIAVGVGTIFSEDLQPLRIISSEDFRVLSSGS